MIIVHGENSTAEPVWHANPTVRGTWSIYQTCIVTIFLCVWTTIHLNVPAPGEKRSKQLWSRIGWSALTIIAPELVALNAWAQYREARFLVRRVNRIRRSPASETPFRHFLNTAALACFAPCRILDWLLARPFSISGMRALGKEDNAIRSVEQQIQWDTVSAQWTMTMAFLVIDGGCVHCSTDLKRRVVQGPAICWLATHEPEAFLPIQRAALLNPSKANGVAKAITCVQALWFCVQCIARLSQGLAVSLLELNTFAHCVSTFLIYLFWWDKSYEVDSHVLLESKAFDLYRTLPPQRLPTLPIITREARDAHLPRYDISRRGTCIIYDPNGNPLMNRFCKLQSWNLIKDCHADYTVPWLESQFEGVVIPGTGFYMSSSLGQDASDRALIMTEGTVKSWQHIWHSWLKSGRPVPLQPIDQTQFGFRFWFEDRQGNISRSTIHLILDDIGGYLVPVIMAVTFAVYGGLHLLAWQYRFGTRTETLLWRISSVMTGLSGLVILQRRLGTAIMERITRSDFEDHGRALCLLGYACHLFGAILELSAPYLALLNAAARAFLVIESFKALPNSPPSTYVIPNWAAYIPHI